MRISVRSARTLVAAVMTAGLVATALPAAAAAPDGTGDVTYRAHEAKRGDVRLSSRRWIVRATHDPRDVNATAFRYTVDRDNGRFRFLVKVDDLSRPSAKEGNTTLQYVDLFVGYREGRRVVDAFGLGADTSKPRSNALGADPTVVSGRCARSVRRAPVRIDFKRNTVRGSVSLSCIPVGTEIHVSGWSEMWVNPPQPPNRQIASDHLEGIDFTRTAR